MKKPKRYVRIKYDIDRDEYRLESSCDGEADWNLLVACTCVPAIMDNGTKTEPNYVHFSILTELQRAVDLGYTFVAR